MCMSFELRARHITNLVINDQYEQGILSVVNKPKKEQVSVYDNAEFMWK